MIESETSPVGRFQILDPENFTLPMPAVCALCGAHNRPVITFQLMVRFYGSVMFCLLCTRSMLTDLGGAIGVTSIENFRAVRDERNRLHNELLAYKEIFDGLHTDLNDLLQRRINSVAVGGDFRVDLGGSPTEDFGTDEVRDGENSTGDDSGAEVTESEESSTAGKQEQSGSLTDERDSKQSREPVEIFFGDLETA